MSYTSFEVGDQVKIIHEDKFMDPIKEGDIFQVESIKHDTTFPTTLEVSPVESEYEGVTQISFKHWVEKIT